MTVDQLKSPLVRIDEFALFTQAVNTVAAQRPQELAAILGGLSKDQNLQLKELLQTKRISLAGPGQENGAEPGTNPERPQWNQNQAARKVLRASRRAPQQPQQQ